MMPPINHAIPFHDGETGHVIWLPGGKTDEKLHPSEELDGDSM